MKSNLKTVLNLYSHPGYLFSKALYCSLYQNLWYEKTTVPRLPSFHGL